MAICGSSGAATSESRPLKVCIVGISGKLGLYMLQHCLDRGYAVRGVCRPESVDKLEPYKDRVEVFAGKTNDRGIVQEAVEGCDAVLVVLVPWGVENYASGTAQAVLDFCEPNARLIFSCGWHITKDGADKYAFGFQTMVKAVGWIAKLLRFVDIDDQVRACDRVFASDKRWTVVRGSDLEEGESEGLPVWSEHVGDPILESNLVRRVDFALFMVAAITDDSLVHQAPAIVGCKSKSALAHAKGT